MRTIIDTLRGLKTLAMPASLALAACLPLSARLPAQAQMPAPSLQTGAFSVPTVDGEINEDQLKQLLVGKTLYLRPGYLDNTLEFDVHGQLSGHSPKGSFTLSQIQINRVKLTKRRLELEGDRFGLHFLGAAPFEDPTTATDRVKITPKKKSVRLFFDREQVEKPKKKDKNENKKDKRPTKLHNTEIAAAPSSTTSPAVSESAVSLTPAPTAPNTPTPLPPTRAHASRLLMSALDTVLSVGIDERMIAAMPEFWRVYYQAAANNSDFKPADPGVLRQSTVDQKARLIAAIEPPSNEFAQANGVAGMALYHAVVGRDGKVQEVIVGRPIGFGLDESAEQTILKAAFQPALKDGKPVPVALDLVVSFRIFSKRTSQPVTAATQSDAQAKPGPYTVLVETAQASSPAR